MENRYEPLVLEASDGTKRRLFFFDFKICISKST
jgi:hypothetical protein